MNECITPPRPFHLETLSILSNTFSYVSPCILFHFVFVFVWCLCSFRLVSLNTSYSSKCPEIEWMMLECLDRNQQRDLMLCSWGRKEKLLKFVWELFIDLSISIFNYQLNIDQHRTDIPFFRCDSQRCTLHYSVFM